MYAHSDVKDRQDKCDEDGAEAHDNECVLDDDDDDDATDAAGLVANLKVSMMHGTTMVPLGHSDIVAARRHALR